MNIGGVVVAPGQPCRVVAEMSANHNGDLGRAHRLIDAAKEAGADFVKFQCYAPDELVRLRGDGPAPEPWGSQGYTMRALYEKAQTPHDWWGSLVDHCERIGLPWFSSVFGLCSLRHLEAFDCPAYKVAALDRESAILPAVSLTGRPVIVSRRGPPEMRGDENLCLLCPEGYPQGPEAIQWEALRRRGRDGLSYHGTDPRVPAKAAEYGALMVECHIQLDDEPGELDGDVSLTASQFAEMVRLIRATEEARCAAS